MKNNAKSLAKTVDAPTTMNDKRFEKLKVIIAELTERWMCEIHSLPDKPSLCWTPKDQLGTCYPITQSNLNFWASRIVSYSILRLSTSPGYPRLITGIPMGFPMGMETHGSESLVITGLCGSGCVLWVLQVPATGTCQTIVFYFLFFVRLK